MRKPEIRRRSGRFDERDIEIGIDVHDFCLQLLIRRDYTGFRNEKPGTRHFAPLPINDCWFGAACELFEGKLRFECCGLGRCHGGNRAGKRAADGLQVDLKMIGLEQPIPPMKPAVKVDLLHGTFGESDFPRSVAGQRNACHHQVLQAFAKSGARAVKITSGKALLQRRAAYGNAIESNSGSQGIARNLRRFRQSSGREAERNSN